jgi:hypothetical protein
MGAEILQHQLGVIAAPLLLDHRRGPRRGQAREQYGRFDLRRGDRRAIDDRNGIARAFQRQRQAAVRCAMAALRAHLFQRIENAPHRPRAQARVAVEDGNDRRAGDRPHRQPAAGARIAEIQRLFRGGEACDADAPHRPDAVAVPFDPGAQGPHGFGGVEDVLALQKPRNPGLAHGKRPQNEGPLGDRLVARDPDAAGQGSALAGLERRFGTGMRHRR